MEENNNMNLNVSNSKSSKNTILIIIIVIISLLLLGLTYYTFFVRDTNKVDEGGTKPNQSEKEDDDKTNTSLSTSPKTIDINYSVTKKSLGTIVVSKDGYVYLIGVSVKSDEIGKKIGVKGTYEVEGYSGTGTNFPESLKFEGYKLDVSNIISAYFFPSGNGGMGYHLILIDKDYNASDLFLTGDYNKGIITNAELNKNFKDNIVSAMAANNDTISKNYLLIYLTK